MTYPIVQLKPQYGVNYRAGDVMFSYRLDNPLSLAITAFENCGLGAIKPSHVRLITSDLYAMGAEEKGISTTDLRKSFEDPHELLIIKRPIGLTECEAKRVIDAGREHFGESYDYGLIAGMAFESFAVALDITRSKSKPAFFNDSRAWDCSEFVSHCLKAIPRLAALEPLAGMHESRIAPMDLLSSEDLWEVSI